MPLRADIECAEFGSLTRTRAAFPRAAPLVCVAVLQGPKRVFFNMMLFSRWQTEAFIEAMIITAVCLVCLENSGGVSTASGLNHDIW